MRSKWLIGLLVILVIAVAAVFLDPTLVLWGYIKREPFFNGRPVSYWNKALQNQDSAMQAEATQKLKDGGPAAAPILVALLTEKTSTGWASATVRVQVADLLGQMGQQEGGVKALVVALGDEDPHVRKVAATSLRTLAPASREAIPKLAATLAAGDAASIEAARALCEFRAEASPAIPELLAALKAKDSVLRWNAAKTLGKIGPSAKDTVPALIAAFTDEDAEVREHAAEALGDIGPDAKDGVPELIKLLKDPAPKVRKDAARSLGKIGPSAKSAVPALKPLLKDEDVRVRDLTAQALRILDPEYAKDIKP